MSKVSILKEKELGINVDAVVNHLNQISKYMEFQNSGLIEFEEVFIEYPRSHQKAEAKIWEENVGNRFVLLLSDKPYFNNYYYEEYDNLQIVSFYNWKEYTGLSMENGLLYFISDLIAQEIDEEEFSHDEKTGCIYDFLWDKSGIDDCMRQAFVCPVCLDRILTRKLSKDEKLMLDDLKILMNDLSSASKWNKSILEYWEEKGQKTDGAPRVQSRQPKKRKSLEDGNINVLIASPGDVDKERVFLRHRLETEFRRAGYENQCQHRLIVHGWEDLASQPGYAQDIINEVLVKKVDIVVGVFKHKLGTPTVDVETGNQRAESGTVEEILYAIKNSELETPPLGMVYFYSKAPMLSVDSPDLSKVVKEWERLEKFKNDIRNYVIYKPYNTPEELLGLVCRDISQNINRYFLV